MTSRFTQFGGTFFGFLLGLVVGVGAATYVIYYVKHDSIPILDGKFVSRPSGDMSGNANTWDPNRKIDQSYQASAPAATSTPTALPAATPQATNNAASPNTASVTGKVTTPPPAASAAQDGATSSNVNTAPALGNKPAASPDKNYYLQIGAFKNKKDAVEQSAKLQLLGFEPVLSEYDNNGIVLFRVRMGPYASVAEVKTAKGHLTDQGVSSFEVAPGQ